MKNLLPLLFLLGSSVAMASEEAHEAAGGHEAAAGGHEVHGIPWMPIGLHTLNLVILLGVLAKFAWPQVRDALKNRAAGIKKEIDEANAARKAAEEKFAEINARVAGMESELAKMRQNAEADAARERALLLQRAQDEAAQIKAGAQRQIADQMARARQELREEAARLAVDLARTQIEQVITQADQDRLGAAFLTTVNAQREGGLHG